MTKTRGRPLLFDPETALGAAMTVFWELGFEGASLVHLTKAMGLNKPSLYATFGDKEALYLKVLERYKAVVLHSHSTILETEPDIWKALESLLRWSAAALTDPSLPVGCLIVSGTTGCGGPGIPSSVKEGLRIALDASEAAILGRLEKARKERALPVELDPKSFAALVAAWMSGMAVQAKAGATRAKLESGIDAAIAMWSSIPMPDPNAAPRSRAAASRTPVEI